MARAIIEILGDASSAKQAARETSAVYQRLEVDMKQLSVSARASADAQVSASLHKTTRLRAEIAAYGEIGAAAKLGSREQIAAAELAARAQARLGKISPQAVLAPGGAARIQVLESVKQTEALRAEALAYQEVAAAAKHGSQEQVAAAQLASRAQRQLATSLGVSSGESAALSRSAGHAERDLGRVTRGALAGSGIFRSLGRSIAFAGGGFLVFASASGFLRTSIDAAKDALVTQRQLGKQLQNDGRSFKDYRGQIEQTNLRLSALSGFTKEDLDQSLTTILRTTSNVSKALRDNALAANIARARHIGLAQAALVVAKTEAGNTTLLRRQGFQISKNATVEQALAIVRAKVAGQARAGTTAQERFGAVLHDSEVIIGAGLLPTLNKYLASGATWLSQMNESGRLQKDVAGATRTVGQAFGAAKTLAEPLIEAFRVLERVSGGTKHALELLGTAFLVLEARSKLIRWGLISSEIQGVGTSAVVASGEVATLRTRLLGLSKLGPIVIAVALSFIPPNKKGQDALDKAGLGFLGRLPIIGHAEQQVARGGQVTHDFLFGPPKPTLPKPLRRLNPATRGFVQSTPANPSGELRFGDPTEASRRLLNRTFEQAKLLNPAITRKTFELGQKVAQAYIDGLRTKPKSEVTLPTPKTPKTLSLQGRFNLAELRLAQAQLTKTSADDKAILRTEAAIVRQQIASSKTLKDKTALTQKLVGIMGQLKGAAKAASDAFTLPGKFDLAEAKAAATKATGDDLAAARQRQAFITKLIGSGRLRGKKLTEAYQALATVNDQITSAESDAQQAIKDASDKRQAALQGRQFRALGLDASGGPLVPATKALRRQLGSISTVISGTFLDTSKTQSVLSKIRRVLSGGIGAVTKDVRSQIKSMLDDIDKQLKDHNNGGPETKFQKPDLSKLTSNLTISPADRKKLEGRLSLIQSGGRFPVTKPTSVSVSDTTVIHTHVELDGQRVGTSVTRHQQRQRRRNPAQKRGPHAGGGI